MLKTENTYFNFLIFSIISALDKIQTAFALTIKLEESNPILLYFFDKFSFHIVLMIAYMIPIGLCYLFISKYQETKPILVKRTMTIINILYIIAVLINTYTLFNGVFYGI